VTLMLGLADEGRERDPNFDLASFIEFGRRERRAAAPCGSSSPIRGAEAEPCVSIARLACSAGSRTFAGSPPIQQDSPRNFLASVVHGLVKRTFPLDLLDRESWCFLVETSPT
jgi:hypothetical protein